MYDTRDTPRTNEMCKSGTYWEDAGKACVPAIFAQGLELENARLKHELGVHKQIMSKQSDKIQEMERHGGQLQEAGKGLRNFTMSKVRRAEDTPSEVLFWDSVYSLPNAQAQR